MSDELTREQLLQCLQELEERHAQILNTWVPAEAPTLFDICRREWFHVLQNYENGRGHFRFGFCAYRAQNMDGLFVLCMREKEEGQLCCPMHVPQRQNVAPSAATTATSEVSLNSPSSTLALRSMPSLRPLSTMSFPSAFRRSSTLGVARLPTLDSSSSSLTLRGGGASTSTTTVTTNSSSPLQHAHNDVDMTTSPPSGGGRGSDERAYRNRTMTRSENETVEVADDYDGYEDGHEDDYEDDDDSTSTDEEYSASGQDTTSDNDDEDDIVPSRKRPRAETSISKEPMERRILMSTSTSLTPRRQRQRISRVRFRCYGCSERFAFEPQGYNRVLQHQLPQMLVLCQECLGYADKTHESVYAREAECVAIEQWLAQDPLPFEREMIPGDGLCFFSALWRLLLPNERRGLGLRTRNGVIGMTRMVFERVRVLLLAICRHATQHEEQYDADVRQQLQAMLLEHEKSVDGDAGHINNVAAQINNDVAHITWLLPIVDLAALPATFKLVDTICRARGHFQQLVRTFMNLNNLADAMPRIVAQHFQLWLRIYQYQPPHNDAAGNNNHAGGVQCYDGYEYNYANDQGLRRSLLRYRSIAEHYDLLLPN
jgi:hypothetical protein